MGDERLPVAPLTLFQLTTVCAYRPSLAVTPVGAVGNDVGRTASRVVAHCWAEP